MTSPTAHYIPDKQDLENFAELLESAVTSDIVRLGKVALFNEDDPPFEVLASSWEYPNLKGPLTLERFEQDACGAVHELARLIDDRGGGAFRSYPMTWMPKTVEGVGYIDFQTFKVDVRLVAKYGFLPNYDDYGFSFHIVTLVGKTDGS